MAPAQSKLANKRKDPPYPPLDTVVCSKKKQAKLKNDDTPTAASAEVASLDGEDKSAASSKSSATPIRKDPYTDLKKKLKQHRSPPEIKQEQKLKKAFPPPGNGKCNRIYTTGTMDDSSIAFVTHKKNYGEYAFTKTVDDMIRKDPKVMRAFGLDNIFLRVDPNDGNQHLLIEYINRDKQVRHKTATIYHRKPHGVSSKAKREKWADNVLVPYFNKYGQQKYSDRDWGDEKFEYGGDLETGRWCDYLGDFITNDCVVSVMKEDYGFGKDPLTCEKMAEDRQLVEMYFGPAKVEEGIASLLSHGKQFHTGETDSDAEPMPYESDGEEHVNTTE